MTMKKYEETLMKFSRETLEGIYKEMEASEQKDIVKRCIERKISNSKRRGFGSSKERAREAGKKGAASKWANVKTKKQQT